MANLLSLEALEADRAFVQRQRETQASSPWGTAALMWEQRLAEINRQIEELKASRSSAASIALIFDGLPVVGQSDIRLDFSTEALASYQKIISACAASLNEKEVNLRGKVKGAHKSKLYIRDLVRGSMGFILEELEPPQVEMFSTPLKNAVEWTTTFIASLNTASVEDFNRAVDEAEPRLVGAVQRFAKVLRDAGASAKILGDENRLSLDTTDVQRLWDRFSDIAVDEENRTMEGKLLGILPDAQEFELEIEGGGILKGVAGDDLTTKYVADQAFKEQLLLKPVIASLKHTTTRRAGRVLREQVILENLEPRIVNEDYGRF